MTDSLQDRTVRIELPLENGKYNYFSGYVLANGLIITCYHGFSNTSNHDYSESGSIEITSYKYSESPICIEFSATDVDGLREELFAYYNEEFDIAVLKCSDAVTSKAAKIYEAAVRNRDEFDSGGYPTFNKDLTNDESKGYKPVYGEAECLVDGSKVFCIKVDSNIVDEHWQWQAISGGPVLINGALAGVFKEYRETSSQLAVVSLKLLMEESIQDGSKPFKDFINGLAPEGSTYFHDRINHVLYQNNDNLLALLKRELVVDTDEQLRMRLSSMNREELVSTLEVHSDKQVTDLACLLLSLSYADEVLEKGVSENGQVQPYFELSCARQEACELILAFHSQRDPILYLKQNDEGNDIISAGKYCINTPPEGGIGGPSAEEISKDLLAGKADTSIGIVERLYKKWNAGSEEEFEASEWEEAANFLLSEENGKYYWRLPKSLVRDASALHKLQERLPLLKLIRVTGGISIAQEERKVANKLMPILRK